MLRNSDLHTTSCDRSPECPLCGNSPFRKRWYFYIPEEHLHYFNRQNLAGLLQMHGFDVINVGATYKPVTWKGSDGISSIDCNFRGRDRLR